MAYQLLDRKGKGLIRRIGGLKVSAEEMRKEVLAGRPEEWER